MQEHKGHESRQIAGDCRVMQLPSKEEATMADKEA